MQSKPLSQIQQGWLCLLSQLHRGIKDFSHKPIIQLPALALGLSQLTCAGLASRVKPGTCTTCSAPFRTRSCWSRMHPAHRTHSSQFGSCTVSGTHRHLKPAKAGTTCSVPWTSQGAPRVVWILEQMPHVVQSSQNGHITVSTSASLGPVQHMTSTSARLNCTCCSFQLLWYLHHMQHPTQAICDTHCIQH